MGKLKISKRQRIFSKNFGPKNPKIVRIRKEAHILRHNPSAALIDEKLMAQAFWQCLKDNEPEETVDVVATYLEQVNKLKLSKEKEIPRDTLYRGL
jgi:hypothetical protein